MQKVVSIVWYKILPAVFGGQKGIAGFQEELSRHIQMTCICSSANRAPLHMGYKLLASLPVTKWQFLNPMVWRKICTIVRQERPSHLIIEHPYHGLAAIFSRRSGIPKLIVHSHNIEANRFRRMGKWWGPLLKYYEQWVHRRADLSLFKTAEDRDWAIEKYGLDPDTCLTIPYGIERVVPNHDAVQEVRSLHGISEDEKILLYAGSPNYLPNRQAINDICHQLIPRLDQSNLRYRIILCGGKYPQISKELSATSAGRIIIAGEVQDISKYYSAADIFINPTRHYGGIQTKNIEAMGNNCTLVCFEETTAGIPKEICGKKLLPVENGNWDKFTANIMEGLKSKYFTPTSFYDHFSWQHILQPLILRIKGRAQENN